MAILVLFEHFSDKFCLNFLILILSNLTLPNMMHFVRTFSIKLILSKEARNYRKTVFMKNIVENGW